MPNDLPLQCSCGSVQGVVTDISPQNGNRLVCMCDDCQAYAHCLKQAEKILDANGGTEIFQVTPSQIKITQGQEHIRCVRLTKNGLMRWYASCCNTPVANTVASAKVPFVGVPHTFMDTETRDHAFGPVIAKIHGRFGKREVPADVHPRAPVSFILRCLRIFLKAWLKGKHKPSPFFDPQTGKPLITPRVLSPTEREELR